MSAQATDEDGKALERRVTGYDLTPTKEHDIITSYEVCKVWQMTPTEFVETLTASEWLRRIALHKAASWSMPTRQTIANRLHKKRLGR